MERDDSENTKIDEHERIITQRATLELLRLVSLSELPQPNKAKINERVQVQHHAYYPAKTTINSTRFKIQVPRRYAAAKESTEKAIKRRSSLFKDKFKVQTEGSEETVVPLDMNQPSKADRPTKGRASTSSAKSKPTKGRLSTSSGVRKRMDTDTTLSKAIYKTIGKSRLSLSSVAMKAMLLKNLDKLVKGRNDVLAGIFGKRVRKSRSKHVEDERKKSDESTQTKKSGDRKKSVVQKRSALKRTKRGSTSTDFSEEEETTSSSSSTSSNSSSTSSSTTSLETSSSSLLSPSKCICKKEVQRKEVDKIEVLMPDTSIFDAEMAAREEAKEMWAQKVKTSLIKMQYWDIKVHNMELEMKLQAANINKFVGQYQKIEEEIGRNGRFQNNMCLILGLIVSRLISNKGEVHDLLDSSHLRYMCVVMNRFVMDYINHSARTRNSLKKTTDCFKTNLLLETLGNLATSNHVRGLLIVEPAVASLLGDLVKALGVLQDLPDHYIMEHNIMKIVNNFVIDDRGLILLQYNATLLKVVGKYIRNELYLNKQLLGLRLAKRFTMAIDDRKILSIIKSTLPLRLIKSLSEREKSDEFRSLALEILKNVEAGEIKLSRADNNYSTECKCRLAYERNKSPKIMCPYFSESDLQKIFKKFRSMREDSHDPDGKPPGDPKDKRPPGDIDSKLKPSSKTNLIHDVTDIESGKRPIGILRAASKDKEYSIIMKPKDVSFDGITSSVDPPSKSSGKSEGKLYISHSRTSTKTKRVSKKRKSSTKRKHKSKRSTRSTKSSKSRSKVTKKVSKKSSTVFKKETSKVTKKGRKETPEVIKKSDARETSKSPSKDVKKESKDTSKSPSSDIKKERSKSHSKDIEKDLPKHRSKVIKKESKDTKDVKETKDVNETKDVKEVSPPKENKKEKHKPLWKDITRDALKSPSRIITSDGSLPLSRIITKDTLETSLPRFKALSKDTKETSPSKVTKKEAPKKISKEEPPKSHKNQASQTDAPKAKIRILKLKNKVSKVPSNEKLMDSMTKIRRSTVFPFPASKHKESSGSSHPSIVKPGDRVLSTPSLTNFPEHKGFITSYAPLKPEDDSPYPPTETSEEKPKTRGSKKTPVGRSLLELLRDVVDLNVQNKKFNPVRKRVLTPSLMFLSDLVELKSMDSLPKLSKNDFSLQELSEINTIVTRLNDRILASSSLQQTPDRRIIPLTPQDQERKEKERQEKLKPGTTQGPIKFFHRY